MEPEKKNQNLETSTVGDLQGEGIEIVNGSRSAEDNEFGTPETEAAKADAPSYTDDESILSADQTVDETLKDIDAPSLPQPIAKQVPTPSTSFAQKSSPKPMPEPVPKRAAAQPIDLTEQSFAAGGVNSATPAAPILKNDPSIKPLRTFKTDAEEAVRYQNISTADMIVAEQKKRESTQTKIEYEDDKRPFPFLLVFLVLIIIVLAGGAYYWFFMRVASVPRSNLPANLVVRTIIPYNGITTVTLDPEADPLTLVASALDKASVNIGEVYVVIPLPFGTTTAIASPSALLSGTKIPGRLIRSLSAEYMTGTYVFNRNAPFLIFKNTFFQNAYAGMLEWENDMRNDLLRLIRVAHPDETAVSIDGDIFEDVVVANIDARVLYGAQSQPILTYAFADQSTLIVATDIETLRFLIDKILTVRVVQ